MATGVITLFGAAERGKIEVPYFCKDLLQLFDYLGQPPDGACGLFFAIQSILYGWPIVYFRVCEEGESHQDYLYGLRFLRNCSSLDIKALFLPGVGSKELIEESFDLCRMRQSLLIMKGDDFYDYITALKQ